MSARAPLLIEIVSDVMCPWCFIGERRLEAALRDRPDLEVKISFTPFLLDPGLPAEGADLRARLEKKYGVAASTMFARVEGIAKSAGVPMDFSKISRAPNTLGAHVLLTHAEARGTQRALADALFVAYFRDGEDVGDPTVLARIASEHGFTADEARALVESDDERRTVKERAMAQPRRGVTGVPHFIVDQRYVVPGAQDEATWLKVLEKVAPSPKTEA